MKEPVKITFITDRLTCPVPMEEAVDSVLKAGFTTVQLREKDLVPRDLYALAQKIKPFVKKYNALFLINSSVEVALAVDADGVHLSWTALPISPVHAILPKGKIIGFSAHNIDEAVEAVKKGANYISISPIFQTPSKRGIVPTIGLDGLEAVVKQVNIPVLALGGITEKNVRAVMECGASGFSIKSRAFAESNNFYETAKAIVQAAAAATTT